MATKLSLGCQLFYAVCQEGTVGMTLEHKDSISGWQTDEHISAFTDHTTLSSQSAKSSQASPVQKMKHPQDHWHPSYLCIQES